MTGVNTKRSSQRYKRSLNCLSKDNLKNRLNINGKYNESREIQQHSAVFTLPPRPPPSLPPPPLPSLPPPPPPRNPDISQRNRLALFG